MNIIKRILVGINLPNGECMDFSVGKENITSIEEKNKTLPNGEQVLVYKIFKEGKLYSEIFWNNQIALFY